MMPVDDATVRRLKSFAIGYAVTSAQAFRKTKGRRR